MTSAPGSVRVPRRHLALVGRFGPPLAVVVVVVVSNLPGLVGIVHPNPLVTLGGATLRSSSGYLPGTWYTDPNVGWTAQALGHLAALDWLHLKVPWWNPFEGVGSPLAAEMQSAAFFPPVLLFALSNGSVLFHVFLEATAGLATYFLVREIGLSRLAATAGGVLFGLNGTFAWLDHAPMNPVPMLPLLLLGIERTFRHPDRDSGWILVALSTALSFYAGFPEVTYFELVMGAAWALVRLATTRRGTRARLAAVLGLGGGAGALLSLPLALPFAEYLPHAFTGVHAQGVGHQHLAAIALPILGLPYLYGPLGSNVSTSTHLGAYYAPVGGFVTASTVVLAVAGLAGTRRDRALRIFLGVFTGTVVAWSFGVAPFTVLASILPYMSHIALTRYSTPVWEMGFVLLACFGLDRQAASRRARLGFAAGGAGALALGAVIWAAGAGSVADRLAHVRPSARAYTLEMLLFAVGLVAVVTALGMLRRRWCLGVIAAIAVLDAVVMAGSPQLSAPRSYQLDTAPVSYLRAHLGDGRYFSFLAYHSDYGSYFGLAQLDETDLPVPSAFATEITKELGDNSYPVHFDGAQVLHHNGPSAVSQALTFVNAYEALDVRYFVSLSSRRVFGAGPDYKDGLRLVYHDPLASIYALPHPVAFFTTTGGDCTVVPAGRDHVTATCRGPATLVRSELDMAGWTATVNGRTVPVLDHQGLLTAVRLPAGRSVVAFSYAPPHIDLALAGFAVGGATILLVPIERRRRVRRRGSTEVGSAGSHLPDEPPEGAVAALESPEDGGEPGAEPSSY